MSKEEETAKKMAIAKALLGNTTGASKGKPPPRKPEFKARPTGGLNPDGFKAKVTYKF